jgi:DHA1 family tetracycline resistance protein-like MFS transporter
MSISVDAKRRMIFVILSLALLDSMGMSLIYPLFSSLLFHKGWNFVDPSTSEAIRGLWLGTLLAATQMVQVIFSPPIGKLSDMIGRRPVIIGCTCAKLLGYLLAIVSITQLSLIGLLISRILLGFSTCEYPVIQAAIADISDMETKRKRFAQINMAFGLGFSIGPCIGGALLAYGSPTLPFLAAFILCLLDGVLVLTWFFETKHQQSEQNDSIALWSAFRGIHTVHPLLTLILLAAFLYCFGWSFYYELIPSWWITALGAPPQQVSKLFAYGRVWYALGCGVLAGIIAKKSSPTLLLQSALLVLSMCIFAVLFFSKSLSAFFVFIPLHNVLASCIFPVCAIAVSDMAPANQQGRIMGLHASAEGIGFSLSPIFSGLSLGIHPLMPVYIGGLSILVAGILVLTCRRMSSKMTSSNQFTTKEHIAEEGNKFDCETKS